MPASAPAKPALASIFTKADPSKAEFTWHAQYRGCIHFQWGKPKPSTKVSDYYTTDWIVLRRNALWLEGVGPD